MGDFVGWGHRDGNMSRQQVGVVVALEEKPVNRYSDRMVWRARCRWSSSWSSPSGYTSSTDAEDLFLLDPRTLAPEIVKELR